MDQLSLKTQNSKWYLNTTLICIFFAFTWLFLIPGVIGCILLMLKRKSEKELQSHLITLETENANMKSILTPEMQDAVSLANETCRLHAEKSQLESSIQSLNKEVSKIQNQINQKKKFLISMDDEILVQEFGLYTPTFDFMNSESYKQKMQEYREREKDAIKNNQAATGNQNWTVNGSKAQGTKMVKDMQKLLLRAFNNECDDLIGKVKYNNFDASLKRMTASRDAISKLGAIVGVSVTSKYYDYKVAELKLALEYQIKKQEEKEAAKVAREEMKEAAKLQKEIDEQRKKIEKEQNHYQSALSSIEAQIANASPDQIEALSLKKAELESHLSDIETSLKEIDYREANQRAGYVYVISNIGAFGPDVYKIGMTRRLDPQERVDELGSASVPFNFDVHAMIFTNDAPGLEAALHRAFEDRKLNMVNTRREFFHVTLDEIKEVVRKNFDKTVEFIDVPDAEQYRISQKMKAS